MKGCRPVRAVNPSHEATKLDSRTNCKLNSIFDSVNFNSPRKFIARSTTTKCSSASLLTAPRSFAMQSALPLAKETLLHLRRFVPSHWLCPMPLFHRLIGGNCAQASAMAPLGGVCGRIRYSISATGTHLGVRPKKIS